MNYEMLIFDIDGTLWDTAEVTLEGANMIADIYPEVRKVDLSTIISQMGLSLEEIAKIRMPDIPLSQALKYIDLQIINIRELINEKGANIYDGVIDVIKTLSKKYKLGIITNNLDEYAELFMKKANLNEYFLDYMGASSYGIGKDEAIRQMLERNNIKTACYIGDTKKDMLASEKANVDFIYAKYGFGKDFEHNVYINDIKDLLKIL